MSDTERDKAQEPVSRFGETFDRVFEQELDCLRERWESVYGKGQEERKLAASAGSLDSPTTRHNLVGLAFSGGGIRSATINMGIAQALHRRGVFDHVDYMSTVSGGGYLGSSISTAMRKLPKKVDPAEAPDSPEAAKATGEKKAVEPPLPNQGEFPFAYQEPEAPAGTEAAGEPRQVETGFLTWVRNNSNYLATGNFLDWPRIFGVLLRGILANFLVLLPILLLLAVGLVWYHGCELARWEAQDQRLAALREEAADLAEAAERAESRATGGAADVRLQADEARARAEEAAEEIEALEAKAPKVSSLFVIAISIAGIFVLGVLIFPVLIRVYKVYQEGVEQESSVASRGGVEKAFGIILVLIFVAAAAELLPLLIRWFHHLESGGLRGLYAGAGAGSSLAIFTVAGRLLSNMGGMRQKILLLLVGLLGLLIPLVVALYVADDLIYFHSDKQGRAAVVETREFWESAAVPSPAYFRAPHEPMRFFEAPAARQGIRLLPGVLLLILGGGAGAALVGKIFDKGKLRVVFTVVGIAVGAFAGYCLLVLSSQGLDVLSHALGADGIRPDMLVLAMAVVVFFFCWLAIDVNLTGVLGMYRDRLASAYLIGQRWKKDEDGKPTDEVEIFVEPDLNLEDLCGGTPPSLKKREDPSARARAQAATSAPGKEDVEKPLACCDDSKAPYHLINTALNLQGSKDPMLRDRGSDFFMFSKLYYGGHRTGYCQTWRLEKVFPQMDLPTAMGISAAAASPNAGRATNKPLVALMTLLNVRLGYWVPHPGRLWDWLEEKKIAVPKIRHRWIWRIPPWALLREMVSAVNEEDKWVNLSDGGHIENMATYELLRRRCKYIICGDGEADAGLTFGGLATLMRSARIDMGIEIEILLDDLHLDPEGKSRQHAALGRIRYPCRHTQVRAGQPGKCRVCNGTLLDYADDEGNLPEGDDGKRYRCPQGELETGWLLYLKSSFTGDEDETMQEYRAKNPDFPHESTADQFFDEGQFESYRALGFHIADRLFPPIRPGHAARPCKHRDPVQPVGEGQCWDCFTDWFSRLKTNLAPRLSAKHEVLQDQLRRVNKLLRREEYYTYFWELNERMRRKLAQGEKTDSGGEATIAQGKKPAPEDEAGAQKITYAVGLQLDLMENAFLSLNLDQPMNWDHPGNLGWRTLFEDWARSKTFRLVYGFLSHRHSGRFQNFCRLNLGLPPDADQVDSVPMTARRDSDQAPE